MKLLVVCQYFHPEQFRVNDVCFELVRRGHDVTVVDRQPGAALETSFAYLASTPRV